MADTSDDEFGPFCDFFTQRELEIMDARHEQNATAIPISTVPETEHDNENESLNTSPSAPAPIDTDFETGNTTMPFRNAPLSFEKARSPDGPNAFTSRVSTPPDGLEYTFVTTEDTPQAANDTDEDNDSLVQKRGRGRPKGSKNRKTLALEAAEATSTIEKRPVGRPPGSGPRQKEAEVNTDSEDEKRKKPVGRPKKVQTLFGAYKLPEESSINRGLRALAFPAAGPSHRRQVPVAEALSQAGKTTLQSTLKESAAKTDTSHGSNTGTTDILPGRRIPSPDAQDTPVIQDDDPSRTIHSDGDDDDSDNEDDESGLLDDGLGDDDEEDEDDLDGPRSSRRPMIPLRPLPTWLQKSFDSRVGESGVRGSDGLPPLYRDHKTFWFPRPSTFFLLRESNISPQRIYEYDMFLWDPECLVPDGIPCPNQGCGARLWRHGHIRRPRRVVDISRTFWIVGYRYRCPKCVSPSSITFRSWDARILAVLPRPLAAEFPARLSYRSGMSLDAFSFMRSCLQHGMGAKQFSNALLVQHLQKYDQLHLRYLQTLAIRSTISTLKAQKYNSFLPFIDRSSEGFQGFVPSLQWLRDVYDVFIEEHKQELNQHTAMLSAKICAIDHSFKLTKHIAKVDGVQVFIALLTVTNEKGEIRQCDLVATKSHSQFEFALHRMLESLRLYGHEEPCAFYTDAMSDKDFLERCFPSLRKDLVPVEKHSHLDPLDIPEHFQVSVKKSVTAVEDAMRTILELLPDEDSDGPSSITIALDAEWNVEISDRGYVTGRGQTAVLQIAHDTRIYILQIGHMLAGKQLPPLLKQVLSNPRIIKVGRCVAGDLKYLQQACGSSVPFVGGLDLARTAKDRLIVKTARISLADLCATVLGKRLNKNVTERTSTAWEDEELTPAQIRYAALDVYASLAIHNAMNTVPIPSPLPESPETGMAVLLFTNDRTCLIARGTISPHARVTAYDGINITSTRSVIEVQEVVVPGAIVANGTGNKKSLQEFGQAPFHLVCLRSHLRQSVSLPSFVTSSNDSGTNSSNPYESPSTSSSTTAAPDPDLTDFTLDQSTLESGESEFRLGASLLGSLRSNPVQDDNTTTAPVHNPDPTSQAEGERILQEADANQHKWVGHVRSRVMKDPFHVFNMFYISAAHGLLQEFAIALRDAIFIPDRHDKARIVSWGQTQSPPLTWNDLLYKKTSWLWRRCKRIIPPPEELYPLVAKVFQVYGPLKDAKSGLPLFNTAAWTIAKNVLELVQKGFLSDPPGVALFYQLGVDAKTGLPIYRCIRGTNMTEGGVHTHLRSRLPTSGVSIRHVQCCLLDFILRHNLLVGTYNSTGQRFHGHYSIWITNELQEMLCFVQHMLIRPRMITGWVNGNLYQPTKEVQGVLPIPDDLRLKSGMGTYEPSLHAKQPHHFLASMQHTRKPVLPIHNSEERDLFRELMTGDSDFNHPVSGPNWDHAVRLWNNEADVRERISYKLSEQLKVYYNGDWKKNCNIKQTKAMTADVRVPLKKTLRDPQRSLGASKILESKRETLTVPKGLIELPPPESDPSAPPTSTPSASMTFGPPEPQNQIEVVRAGTTAPLASQHLMSSAGPSTSTAGPSESIHGSSSLQDTMFRLSYKRAGDSIAQADGPKRKRKKRTCQKCDQPTCPGSQKADNCRNKCRDCEKYTCRGRNSKFPKKKCHIAWDD